MSSRSSYFRHALLSVSAIVGVAALTTPAAAAAQAVNFDMPAQPLTQALKTYGAAADQQLIYSERLVRGRQAPALKGEFAPDQALTLLLAGSGLTAERTPGGVVTIRSADTDPQSGSAAAGGAEVEALIVTAQKREEDIQDVPIAISAFSQEALEAQKIEGGFDLLKAIPNVTFSKNNFTSYNFSIRGIGTKAVSATTDPGVAVAFNNTALLQNRLFEQEYFDIERVEVLRGPQGTLYGRNATAGVINVISAKPDMNDVDAWVKGEVGNYQTKRVSGMLNFPIVEDRLAVRFAGALTSRQGYDYNAITRHHINGRELWSGRLTIGFNPTDRITSNLIWEHFEEDDDRSRTGKQLCHRDPPVETVGNTSVNSVYGGTELGILRGALFSQGCQPGSLYDEQAFGTPNGLALPFVFSTLALQLGGQFPLGQYPGTHREASLLLMRDPYNNMMQSPDLRTIASFRDPRYQAKADVVELNIDIDVTDELTLTSQSAYNKDRVYSFQDFNRFNTQPVFEDTSTFEQMWSTPGGGVPSPYANLAPGGIFCDPQLGCSNTIAGFDISQGEATQFSQEIRLQSNFDGPLNFSVGANYTRFNVLVDYYVFFNLLTATALALPFNGEVGNPTSDINVCGVGGYLYDVVGPLEMDDPRAVCPYIDPNPIESLNGEGHNYFRSKNPYKLKSAAAFGEIYYNISDTLKVTAGLRYTDDKKHFTPVPSQLLLARGIFNGGTVNRGYPELDPIKQHWKEWTGRFGVDWKPELGFTDDTMLYAFYSRGYKGGGANPPQSGFASREQARQQALDMGVDPGTVEFFDSDDLQAFPVLVRHAVEYGETFEPEYVDAYEIGAKNTLLDGALQFNTGAFFYDYTDYQVSQIRDRTAVNENFDATVWGVEFETRFSPSRNFQIIGNLGYLDTKIADGEKSINIMDRTQGNEGWIVAKPWMQYPSNCIVPIGVAENWLKEHGAFQRYWMMCGRLGGALGALNQNIPPIDPATEEEYSVLNYPEVNGGAGFYEDISGNELPNSPHWTVNLGAQYTIEPSTAWKLTFRGDAYWQSQSWARIYNDNPYDKLHGWYNLNLSAWLDFPDHDMRVEFYVKNVLDKTPITDAFLNSDDLALTTNVFVLDPRLMGLSVRKGF
ncbi:MAG TPA: TonB-dependent receptor [Caulobacteraceae bacterium]|nr:TonB-dependent receptor [Caulobacteraceae bacterium]